MKKIFSLIIITLFVSGCLQNKDSNLFTITDSQERKYAEETLEEVLIKNKDHNFVNSDTNIIETPEIAVKVAEPILFGIYGRKNIIKQRPYKVSELKGYYVIEGILHGGLGGTFLIIMSKKNAEIIKITHGE